ERINMTFHSVTLRDKRRQKIGLCKLFLLPGHKGSLKSENCHCLSFKTVSVSHASPVARLTGTPTTKRRPQWRGTTGVSHHAQIPSAVAGHGQCAGIRHSADRLRRFLVVVPARSAGGPVRSRSGPGGLL